MTTTAHRIIRIAGLAIVFCSTVLARSARAEVQSQEIEYKQGSTVLQGFAAWDDDIHQKRPGILVVHEWWGHNQHARNQALRLARAGYVAFALDMFGKGKVTTHPADAQGFVAEATKDPQLEKARFDAALAQLKKLPQVDSGKVGAIGYCYQRFARKQLKGSLRIDWTIGIEHNTRAGKFTKDTKLTAAQYMKSAELVLAAEGLVDRQGSRGPAGDLDGDADVADGRVRRNGRQATGAIQEIRVIPQVRDDPRPTRSDDVAGDAFAQGVLAAFDVLRIQPKRRLRTQPACGFVQKHQGAPVHI